MPYPVCKNCGNNMMKSKFGQNQWWCPECFKKKKDKKETETEFDQGEQILKALRETYKLLLEIQKEQREFFRMFSENQQ